MQSPVLESWMACPEFRLVLEVMHACSAGCDKTPYHRLGRETKSGTKKARRIMEWGSNMESN